jgi:hypothetical protein
VWWIICDKIVLQTYVLQLEGADVVQDRASTDNKIVQPVHWPNFGDV